MLKAPATVVVLLALPVALMGQSDRLAFIREEVAQIDKDRTLNADSLDLGVATGVWLDGGGTITYHYRGDRLVKIEEQYFPSYGMTLTQYYFHNDTLMLIRDREDDHPLTPDSSGVDPTRLEKRFEASYYVWTLEQDLAREQHGTRVLSEGPCGTKEWAPTVQRLIGLAPRRR
ncbi:MAG: hypothetical protein JNJ91_07635 [Flavobacteriales bacterium]|nr:hypothetical protein [Flavobacteriales bacterium]